MSEDVERRLLTVLNNPTTSPFGNPIPGLSELGVPSDRFDNASAVRLTEIAGGAQVAVVVRRLAEHVQADTDLLTRLKDAGIVPNARVTVESSPDGVIIVIPGHESVELPHEMAHAVMVEKV